MIARLTQWAARRLSQAGQEKHRRSVRETARRMREELGLPPAKALEG